MKILHVLPFAHVPPNFGAALRIFHLLRAMSRRHEVTVVSYGDENDQNALSGAADMHLHGIHFVPHSGLNHRSKRFGQILSVLQNKSFDLAQYRTEEMQRTLDDVCSQQDFDIVQTEFPSMGAFRFNTGAARIIDAHNVEYDSLQRMGGEARSPIRRLYYRAQSRTLRDEEMRIYREHDAVFVTSARDKKILAADVPEVPMYVVPNGVDTSFFRGSGEPREPLSLVFTGTMNYLPNSDGMIRFLDEIFPRIQRVFPEVKIYIVGNLPSNTLLKRRNRNIIITGHVPDVRPFINRASVYVVPLWMGGGTRLKVLEALAMGIPAVTTSIGCEGIEVEDGETILVKDDPVQFAEAVIDLVRDSHLRGKLAANGHVLVRSLYDWSCIGEKVEELYASLAVQTKAKAQACA